VCVYFKLSWICSFSFFFFSAIGNPKNSAKIILYDVSSEVFFVVFSSSFFQWYGAVVVIGDGVFLLLLSLLLLVVVAFVDLCQIKR